MLGILWHNLLFLTKKETQIFLHFECFSLFDLQILDFAIEAKSYWEKVEIEFNQRSNQQQSCCFWFSSIQQWACDPLWNIIPFSKYVYETVMLIYKIRHESIGEWNENYTSKIISPNCAICSRIKESRERNLGQTSSSTMITKITKTASPKKTILTQKKFLFFSSNTLAA